MIIKTKKYQLPKSKYKRIAFFNVMRRQWWFVCVLAAVAGGLFYYKYNGWGTTITAGVIFYLVFRYLQVYAITFVEQNKLLFSKYSYVISSKQILMQLTTKQGVPIAWHQIKYVRKGKDDYLLFLDTIQFIHLPHRIFSTPQELRFLDMLLQRKKFIK